MYRRVRRRAGRGARRGRAGGKRRGRRGVGRRRTGGIGAANRRGRERRREVGIGGARVIVNRGTWMSTRNHRRNWTRRYDSVTTVMREVVRVVSRRVHRYSTEYIGGDAHRRRFIGYRSRFTRGIRILVTAETRVQRYIGWEGVGVCSYRLINYWYTRRQANKAAIKAMRVNRVGDRARGWGRSLCVKAGGGVGRGRRRGGQERAQGSREREVAGVRMYVAAIGKSAQRGLHVWLPDAMEGPTPVSALIHAATMVTAGVYRRVRRSPRRGQRTWMRVRIGGGRTARYAGTIGVVQHDRKRVIAYSTCSQLGYMRSGCGREGMEVARGHLVNHARYKGRLFRGAGTVIHGMGDEQDRRGRGGRGKVRPRTKGRRRRGSRALMGTPYRTGYYSKDVRRERAYGSYTRRGQSGYRRRRVAGRRTATYSMRRRGRGFGGEGRGQRKRYGEVEEAPRRMGRAMGRLGVGARGGGWRRKDRMMGRGSGYRRERYTHPDGRRREESENRERRYKRRPRGRTRGVGRRGRKRWPGRGKERYERKRENKERMEYRNKKWYMDKRYRNRVGRGRERADEKMRRDRGRYERRRDGGRAKRSEGRGEKTGERQTGERKGYRKWRRRGRRRRRRAGVE